MKVLMNLQGFIFRTEQDAKDYYGKRFDHTVLAWVTINEDGDVINENGEIL